MDPFAIFPFGCRSGPWSDLQYQIHLLNIHLDCHCCNVLLFHKKSNDWDWSKKVKPSMAEKSDTDLCWKDNKSLPPKKKIKFFGFLAARLLSEASSLMRETLTKMRATRRARVRRERIMNPILRIRERLEFDDCPSSMSNGWPSIVTDRTKLIHKENTREREREWEARIHKAHCSRLNNKLCFTNSKQRESLSYKLFVVHRAVSWVGSEIIPDPSVVSTLLSSVVGVGEN